jgi:hypothetical protein
MIWPILQNPTVHNHVQKNPPAVGSLIQMNPGHALPFHIIKIYLNSIARHHVTFDNVLEFYCLYLAAPRLTPQAGGPPLIRCPLLGIHYIRRWKYDIIQTYVTVHVARVHFETLVVAQLQRNCLPFAVTQSDCPCDLLV